MMGGLWINALYVGRPGWSDAFSYHSETKRKGITEDKQ